MYNRNSQDGIFVAILFYELKEESKQSTKFWNYCFVGFSRAVFQSSSLCYKESQTGKKVNIDVMGEITSKENSLNVQGIARGKPCINHSGFCSVRSRAAFAGNVPGWLRCLYVLINKKSLRERLFRSKPHTSLLLRQYCLLIPHPNTFYRKYACY